MNLKKRLPKLLRCKNFSTKEDVLDGRIGTPQFEVPVLGGVEDDPERRN